MQDKSKIHTSRVSRRIAAAALAAVTLAVACSSPASTQTAQVTDDSLAIETAVVRAEIARHARDSGGGIEPLRVCLSAKGNVEPSSDLLAALASEHPPVFARSACGEPCVIPKDFEGSRFHCVFLQVGDVQITRDGVATAYGSFLAGPLFGRGGTYRLRRSGTTWEIIGYEQLWVS